jgi:hypothetical protein
MNPYFFKTPYCCSTAMICISEQEDATWGEIKFRCPVCKTERTFGSTQLREDIKE